jgi:flagellar basal body rod protein FlgG
VPRKSITLYKKDEETWTDVIETADSRYATVPIPILRSRVLSSTAKLAIAELMRVARIGREDEQTDRGKISSTELARNLGIKVRSLLRIKKELMDVELLIEYKKSGEFELFKNQQLTYWHLYKLFPTRIDSREVRNKLVRMMALDAETAKLIPAFLNA